MMHATSYRTARRISGRAAAGRRFDSGTEPETPLLPLPSQWNNTPAFKIWELSRYDERGPAWYWNGFETGEHTGTHFDAPIHWVSGKDLPDNTRGPHPAKEIRRSGLRDRRQRRSRAKNPDFLLTPERVEAVGRTARADSGRRMGAAYVQTGRSVESQGLHQLERERPAHPRT